MILTYFLDSCRRHRLVRRFGSTQDTTPEPIVLPLQPNVSNSALAAYQIHRNEFNAKAFNIGFTSKVGCGIPACCEMLLDAASDLKFAAKDPWAAVKKFKMIIDVDGETLSLDGGPCVCCADFNHTFYPRTGMGFSARFLQLFNSGAAIVKHTIYREYTSDWLQPWVHFIPVSPGASSSFHLDRDLKLISTIPICASPRTLRTLFDLDLLPRLVPLCTPPSQPFPQATSSRPGAHLGRRPTAQGDRRGWSRVARGGRSA